VVSYSLARQSGAQHIVGCNRVPTDREESSIESAVVSSDRERRSRYRLQSRKTEWTAADIGCSQLSSRETEGAKVKMIVGCNVCSTAGQRRAQQRVPCCLVGQRNTQIWKIVTRAMERSRSSESVFGFYLSSKLQ
jgi:hypothetical protein